MGSEAGADQLVRLVSLVRRARRFIGWALLVLVLGSAASALVALRRPRVYRSEALVFYREGIRAHDIGAGDDPGDRARRLGLRLKEMVLARSRLARLIDELNLYPVTVARLGMVDAVDELRAHISFRVREGDTFAVGFDGDEPRRVQAVTAALARILVDESAQTRVEQAELTRDFLGGERARGASELRDKELALAQFLARHPEFAQEAMFGGAGTAIRAQEKRQHAVDPTLASLEREAERLQQRLGLPVAGRHEPLGDPALLAARNEADGELRAAQRELAEKRAQFTDEHPDVRAAAVRLKLAQEKATRAADALAADVAALQQNSPMPDPPPVDRAALEAQLKKIYEQIATYRKRRSREPSEDSGANWVVALETDWTRLNREVSEARERLTQLDEKAFKADMLQSAVASGRNPQMVIVDPAFLPTRPIGPRRLVIVAAGASLSLLLAVTLALVLALIDERIYDDGDLARLGVRCLQTIDEP